MRLYISQVGILYTREGVAEAMVTRVEHGKSKGAWVQGIGESTYEELRDPRSK